MKNAAKRAIRRPQTSINAYCPRLVRSPRQRLSREAAERDGRDLTGLSGDERQRHEGGKNRGARLIGHSWRHAQNRLCDHTDRNERQPLQQTRAEARVGEGPRAMGEKKHKERRGQSEPEPCGQPSQIAAANQADSEAGLARRGAGDKLRKGDQIDIGALA
jgi:hypothetical protein